VAIRKTVAQLGAGDLAEGLGYVVKRRLLGKPLVNEELSEQRLSKRLALGVLAPDGISSSAYGTEEILIELLKGGLAVTAFTLILPLTGVVLFVMALVVLSYREVVSVYTRAGGSYVVARENFGPRVAQVAAVALLIDYVVTVAVQVAAGTAAVASAVPAISNPNVRMIISICIVILMCYANLRGIREAGRSFAVPTYLFSGVVLVLIFTGLLREAFGGLHVAAYPVADQYTATTGHDSHSSLITFGLMFVLLRAFANGGSSLTGIEAVSNAVSAFKPPEGINARKVLVTEGVILGTLVAGISWLAHVTHAAPYVSGVPTVLAQEGRAVFGHSAFGTAMFVLIQAATALILYTGGNTSFNGFPFLASFVAEDAFLPRWLTKRGHRLVFSNGIVVLALLSSILLAVAGANVNNLVPFYAIGVFTAFTMAGCGMAKYHSRMREPHWQRKLAINFSAGLISMIVVLIFVVVKFTEGAYLVVILFAIGVPALIFLNREYRQEAEVLARITSREKPPEPPTYARRTVFVFVDNLDLATLAALRYARSLRPTSLRAVHFVLDSSQADTLRQDWLRANTGIALDFVDSPDRRMARAAAEMVSAEAALPGVGVTAILPRRVYSPVARLLHDRTADRIAAVISQIPHAAATIVPFDVRQRLRTLHQHGSLASQPGAPGPDTRGAVPAGTAAGTVGSAAGSAAAGTVEGARGGAAAADTAAGAAEAAAGGSGDPQAPVPDEPAQADSDHYSRPIPPAGCNPIGTLTKPGRAVVEGRVRAVEIRPVQQNTVLACEVSDSTGQLTALFYGRSHIPGLLPGARARFRGPVGIRDGHAVMINPAYELLAHGTGGKPHS